MFERAVLRKCHTNRPTQGWTERVKCQELMCGVCYEGNCECQIKWLTIKPVKRYNKGWTTNWASFCLVWGTAFWWPMAWLLTLLLPLAMWLATCSHVLFTNQAINHCLSLASEVPLAQAYKQLDTGPTGTKTHQGLKDSGQGWSNPLGCPWLPFTIKRSTLVMTSKDGRPCWQG